MAYSFDDGIRPVTFVAGEDLTAKQYYAVKPGSVLGEVKVANGASNPAPIGILQDSGSTGQAVAVKCHGFTLARVIAAVVAEAASAACDVDAGHTLAAGSDGQLHYANVYAFNARSFGFITTGSAVINVLWVGLGASAISAI